MDALKQELRDTVGLLLAHPDTAEQFHITWNGLLFHGPPGAGKSFFVRALAGELGLNLVPVNTADLVTDVVGDGPALVEEAFRFAAAHLPALLFFDELDAVAQARSGADQDSREIVTQLLQSLEEWREERRLLVVGATNDLDSLDPAVVRPGRFDRHIRLDLPDAGGRRAVFAAALAGRPQETDIPFDELARRTAGRSPAGIVQACEVAALTAFRSSIGHDKITRISAQHLLDALDHGGGQDRPMVEHWSWSRLVLDKDTLDELQQVQAMLEDPDLPYRLGVEPVNGVLLTGPPGTGKTTVAKVLAAEARCSFYPASSAELSSRWVGESEKAISRLFRRARANAPSIVFLDEIDAIGAVRGSFGTYDRQLDQLLQEIDGMASQPGVMVLGATNRPNALDPALLRGGRLSRTIELPLPNRPGRLRILQLLTERMPLKAVDLEHLASETEGFSGADLKSLCQHAALESMIRDDDATTVTKVDFERALEDGAKTIADRLAAEALRPRRVRQLRAD
jgi:transitional endoplasmic reticulum ATPase